MSVEKGNSDITDRLGTGSPLLLDGAMGTQLLMRNVDVGLPLWSAAILENSPSTVEKIHAEYLHAGADVVTTNTFRTTTRTFQKVCNDLKEATRRARAVCKTAVEVARRAAGEAHFVAGSVAPLEDCYLPHLFPGENAALEEFRELGNWLVEDGVDFLLIETMGRLDEARCALQAVSSHDIPKWVSFIIKDPEHLLDNSSLAETASMVSGKGVSAILINCSRLPDAVKAVEILSTTTNLPVGLYPNLGKSMPSPDGTIEECFLVEEFTEAMREAISAGARIVGSCCGSGPEHTRALRTLL